MTFHYVGVVNEFPTAPKDSFFVANASYIAAQTGSGAAGAFLVDTGGKDTAAVAARIRTLVGTAATVTDIATVRNSVGSSLTSVDLAGLTRIELSFALVLAVGRGRPGAGPRAGRTAPHLSPSPPRWAPNRGTCAR